MNITDLITADGVAMYYNETAASQEKYLGKMLFPPMKQLGLEISKIRGKAGKPVILRASEFDANATFRDRLSIEQTKEEMPFFREAMKIDEKLRQEIMNVQANQAKLKIYLTQIFDDANNLIKGANVVREYMIMELLSTGKIAIKDNGVDKEFDYGLEAGQFKTLTGTKKWSTDTSNPLKDIDDWVTAFKTEFSTTLARAIMTPTTFGLLKRHPAIVKALYPNSADVTGLIVTSAQVKDLIFRYTGISVLEYNETYAKAVGGASVNFFPDNVVTFFPVGTLGNTHYGTTPEEADLMNSASDANVAIVETGVAVTTRVLSHPVNTETIVSEIILPSFNAVGGNILIARVA